MTLLLTVQFSHKKKKVMSPFTLLGRQDLIVNVPSITSLMILLA